MHAVLRIADAALELGEGRDAGFTAPAALYLYVEDCDRIFAQAVAAGAKPLHPPSPRT